MQINTFRTMSSEYAGKANQCLILAAGKRIRLRKLRTGSLNRWFLFAVSRSSSTSFSGRIRPASADL